MKTNNTNLSTFHRLPFTTLPKLVLIYLVAECANKLNYFPAKLGLSKYYSPRMILQKQTLEFKTHGIYNTGDYVLAHNDSIIKNNLKPRALDCLYLRPTPNSKNTHDFYHISTNKIISRSKCTPLPMTTNIIHLIVAQAKKDNMPEGLKFSTNTNTTVYPPDWIAGVDLNMKNIIVMKKTTTITTDCDR